MLSPPSFAAAAVATAPAAAAAAAAASAVVPVTSAAPLNRVAVHSFILQWEAGSGVRQLRDLFAQAGNDPSKLWRIAHNSWRLEEAVAHHGAPHTAFQIGFAGVGGSGGGGHVGGGGERGRSEGG